MKIKVVEQAEAKDALVEVVIDQEVKDALVETLNQEAKDVLVEVIEEAQESRVLDAHQIQKHLDQTEEKDVLIQILNQLRLAFLDQDAQEEEIKH